ncbi:Do family serine endopeptidase [bacterium]|nr:Do family serine endopeptidase [bacterium]
MQQSRSVRTLGLVAAFAAFAVFPACGQRTEAISPGEPAPETAANLAQLSGPQVAEPTQARVLPASREQITMSFAPVVHDSAPAVVNVYSSKLVRRSTSPFANDPFFGQFFGGGTGAGPAQRVQQSLGSGVIVASDGVIVTNNHVIEGADEFKVMLSDRREFNAELVLADARTDLAVLKIDVGRETLPTLSFADTRGIEVGDLVMAIGNPFGVGQTVTTGIVSALARTDVGVSDFSFFIQTDAAINPGNSGGALVDMSGRLVGVNSAIYSRGGGSNGIGFAVPAEMVKRVVDAAMNDGRIVRPWLGAKGEGVNSELAVKLALGRPRGVLIKDIYPDGPAAKAGLRAGDVVLSIDGREVFDERGMKFVAATFAPGDRAKVDIWRDGRSRELTLTFAPPPGATEAELLRIDGRNPFSGAEVAEISPALAEELGRDGFQTGLLVNRVVRRSIASQLGLRPGDIVREVNGAAIRTAVDLETAIERSEKAGQPIWRLAIERNGERIETSVRI